MWGGVPVSTQRGAVGTHLLVVPLARRGRGGLGAGGEVLHHRLVGLSSEPCLYSITGLDYLHFWGVCMLILLGLLSTWVFSFSVRISASARNDQRRGASSGDHRSYFGGCLCGHSWGRSILVGLGRGKGLWGGRRRGSRCI